MKTIISHIYNIVKKHPEKIALSQGDLKYTYDEMYHRVNSIASYLIDDYNIAPSDRVAIHTDNAIYLPILMLAVMQARATLLLIDRDLPIVRKQLMLKEAQVKLILSTEIEPIPGVSSEYYFININTLKNNHKKISELNVQLDDPAYIFFTSGSTGTPKGILANHKSCIHFLTWQRDTFHLTNIDKCFQTTALSFDVILRSIFTPLISGAELVFPESEINITELKTLENLIMQEVTFFHCVPTLLNIWLSQMNTQYHAKNLRYIFLAGEKLDKMTIVKFQEHINSPVNFINLYGPSETVLAKFYHIVGDIQKYNAIPVGRPLPDTKFYLINDNGSFCTDDEVGEVVIDSEYKSLGYLNANPFVLLSEDMNVANPVYFTGDLGYTDSNKNLYLIGRKDNQIKRDGVRINLEEIEKNIYALINQEVVCYFCKEKNILCAFIKGVEQVSRKDLYSLLKKQLINEMIPDNIIYINKFNYTSSGKIDRNKIWKDHQTKLLVSQNHLDLNKTQKKVFNVISEILNHEISLTDNFFDSGLTSIRTIFLLNKIHHWLSINLSYKDITNHPTILSLSAYIDKINREENFATFFKVIKQNHLKLNEHQRSIVSYMLLHPNSAAYNVPYVFKSTYNSIAINEIKKRIYKLINEHILLRTAIYENSDLLLKETDPHICETIILDNEMALQQTINNLINLPFHLEEPLFRSYILTTESNIYVLLNFSHVITDGFTSEYFIRHLSDSESVNLNYDPSNYHLLKNTKRKKNDSTFWSEYFSSFGSVFFHEKIDYAGNILHFNLPKLNFQKTKSDNNAFLSGFNLYYALFSIFIARLYNIDSTCISVPLSSRTEHDRFELGCFVSAFPIISTINLNESFSEYASRIFNLIGKIYEKKNKPLMPLLKSSNVNINYSNPNIFDFYFSFDETSNDELVINNILFEKIEAHHGTCKYPLSWMLTNKKDILKLEVEYTSSLFTEEKINQLVTMFSSMIECINKDLSLKVKDISWNNTDVLADYKHLFYFDDRDNAPSLIYSIFDKASLIPQHSAIIDEAKNYSYLDLYNAVLTNIDVINNYKVSAGEIVIIALPKGFHLISWMLALLNCDVVYLPIDIKIPKARNQKIIENANPKLIIEMIDDEIICSFFNDRKVIHYQLEKFISIDLNRLNHQAKGRTPAYMLYTSGSTGIPKGILQTHSTLENLINWQLNQLNQISKPRVTLLSEVTFDVSIQSILFSLAATGTLHVLNTEYRHNAYRLWQYINQHRINIVFLPPAILQLLSENPPDNIETDLKYFISAGDVLLITPSIRKLILACSSNIAILNHYGPTETHVVSSYQLTKKDILAEKISIPIGQPISNTQLIVRNKYCDILPSGFKGELLLGGDGVALGYFNDSTRSRDKFISIDIDGYATPFYYSGDSAKLHNDLFYLFGRIDNQISYNGYRIEPADIACVVNQLNFIKENFVCKKEKDECVFLYCYFTSNKYEDESIEREKIRAYCHINLPQYMVPNKYIRLNKFPLTANGKIDIRALPLETENIALKTPSPAETTFTEKEIALINMIKKISGISVLPTTDLLQIGLNSLLIAKFLSEISRSKIINGTIGFVDFLKAPTVKQLIALSKMSSQFQHTVKVELHPSQDRILKDILALDNSQAYNLCYTIELHESINIDKFIKSIRELVSNNQIFNLALSLDNDKYSLAQTETKFTQKLDVINIDDFFDIENFLQELLLTNLFPFNKGFGFFKLLKDVNTKKYMLVFLIHHFIFDGTSCNLFMKELQDRYNDVYTSNSKTKNTYLDLIETYSEETITKNHEYINKTCANINNLILFNSGIQGQLAYKANYWFSIKDNDFKLISRAAQDKSVSLFVILLYCFKNMIVDIYAPQTPGLLIGTTVNGRTESSSFDVMGLFSQRTALYLENRKYQNKNEEINAINVALFDMLDNQLLSLYHADDIKFLMRDKNIATPQFNIVLQDSDNNTFQLGKHKHSMKAIENTKYSLDRTDLSFIICPTNSSLMIEVVFTYGAYNADQLDKMINSFKQALYELIRDYS